MRFTRAFVLLFALLVSTSTYAGGIDSFSSAEYGVKGALPARFTAKVSTHETAFVVLLQDEHDLIKAAGVFDRSRTDFRDVLDWIQHHEMRKLLHAFFDGHDYAYNEVSASAGALQTVFLGSGQKVSVWQERLDISIPVGLEVKHIMRNIAFFYGTTDRGWFYVFLANAGQGTQDLDGDIKTLAAAIQLN